MSISETPFQFGNSSVVSNVPLGVGTWSWGDTKVWGYDENTGRELSREAHHAAVKAGINFFDTAEMYGDGTSERLLGTFAKETSIKPQVIATKFIPTPTLFSASNLKTHLKQSLERLGMESVDLYQIHGLGISIRSAETWAEALAEVHREGLVKAVGVSNYTVSQVRRTHKVLSEHNIPLASNQIEYSLLRREPELKGTIKECHDLGVSVIAYSPLGMGKLTGKYSAKNPPTAKHMFANVPMEKVDPLIEKMRQIGEENGGKTVAQVALNWCICKGTFPICGAKNAQQATDNAGSLGWRLSKEQVAILDEASLNAQSSKSIFSRVWQE